MTDEGELIAGRYRLVSRVGRGAMGVVWQAKDERLNRTVAVKQLLLDATMDEAEAADASRLAMREARIAARLQHPHAIVIHDVVEHDEKPCLIMEYLPSKSLYGILATRGPLPPEEVARIGGQVASALAAAHTAGIVHRDVKPANVLIAEDGTAKITDFGISRTVGDGAASTAGFLAGTPAYLAPEVAQGGKADFPADVFSLGSTLYAAVEGAPPFGLDDNTIAMLQQVAHGEITPPRQAGPLTPVLLSLLQRKPDERPTMRRVQVVLAAVADGQAAPALPLTRQLLGSSRRPRWRGVLGSAAAACLVAMGVLVGVLVTDTDTAGQAVNLPSTTSTSRPAPRTTTFSPVGSECAAQYVITNAWNDGYQVEVTVRNGGDFELTGWTVQWTLPSGHRIRDKWNGRFSQDGSSVTVTNESYNAVVNSSTTFGFVADAPNKTSERPSVSCQSP